MFKILEILLLVFVLFSSFECEKKDEKLLNDIENKLIGEWIWFKTIHFKNDSIFCIRQTKKNDTIISKIFLPDGTYFNFNKKLKEYAGIYWVDYTKNIFDSTKINYILYYQVDNFIEYSYFQIINDSLILDRRKQEGIINYFIRKK